MTLTKILKRRDGSSVVVAVVIALILSQPISQCTAYLAGKIADLQTGQYGTAFPGTGWKGQYLHPVVWALLQLVVLEILAWVYVQLASTTKKK